MKSRLLVEKEVLDTAFMYTRTAELMQNGLQDGNNLTFIQLANIVKESTNSLARTLSENYNGNKYSYEDASYVCNLPQETQDMYGNHDIINIELPRGIKLQTTKQKAELIKTTIDGEIAKNHPSIKAYVLNALYHSENYIADNVINQCLTDILALNQEEIAQLDLAQYLAIDGSESQYNPAVNLANANEQNINEQFEANFALCLKVKYDTDNITTDLYNFFNNQNAEGDVRVFSKEEFTLLDQEIIENYPGLPPIDRSFSVQVKQGNDGNFILYKGSGGQGDIALDLIYGHLQNYHPPEYYLQTDNPYMESYFQTASNELYNNGNCETMADSLLGEVGITEVVEMFDQIQ